MGRTYCIILAAGSGSRFASDIPKQFLRIGDKMIVEHSVDAFRNVADIFVGLPKGFAINIEGVTRFEGGASLWETLYKGIGKIMASRAVSSGDTLIVHDAVRPFVSQTIIQAVLDKSRENSEAVVCPAIPVYGPMLINGQSCRISREQLVETQLPCAVDIMQLTNLWDYSRDYPNIMELYASKCKPVLFVSGDIHNFKITFQRDIETVNNVV